MNSPWQSTFQVNAVESNGWTPLHVAVRREFVPIIRCSAKRMFEACGWMCLCRHIMMSYSYVYIMFLWMSYIIWIYSIHTLHIYIYVQRPHRKIPCASKKTEATCWMPGLMPISPIASGPGDLLLEKTTGWMRKIGSCEGWFLVISGDLWWFMSLITGNLWFWTGVVGSWGNPSSTCYHRQAVQTRSWPHVSPSFLVWIQYSMD